MIFEIIKRRINILKI